MAGLNPSRRACQFIGDFSQSIGARAEEGLKVMNRQGAVRDNAVGASLKPRKQAK